MDWLDKGPLEEPLVKKFTWQLLTAVNYLHTNETKQIIHKDIKGELSTTLVFARSAKILAILVFQARAFAEVFYENFYGSEGDAASLSFIFRFLSSTSFWLLFLVLLSFCWAFNRFQLLLVKLSKNAKNSEKILNELQE